MTVGIESIGIKLPSYGIEARKVAQFYGVPEEKVTLGLGCDKMGLCLDHETVVDLAVEAAQRAIKAWDGRIEDLGMIAVGTESSLDEARPLSAWIAERLNLKGAVRSYEVKHSCYSGTLALRQAAEWKAATPHSSQSALVIAVDICLYAPGHPAELTQGAGAVAMIVGKNKVCSIDLCSYPYSEPCFDFWRPTGQAFPNVDSTKSLSSYLGAVKSCFRSLFSDQPLLTFETFQAMCFHVPFPKIVIKAFKHLASLYHLSKFQEEKILNEKILPFMKWNQEVGNAYSASLWISVAQALHETKPGEKISCFSYGSGFGAELFTLERGHSESPWANHIEKDLANRRLLSIEDYNDWRKVKLCG